MTALDTDLKNVYQAKTFVYLCAVRLLSDRQTTRGAPRDLKKT